MKHKILFGVKLCLQMLLVFVGINVLFHAGTKWYTNQKMQDILLEQKAQIEKGEEVRESDLPIEVARLLEKETLNTSVSASGLRDIEGNAFESAIVNAMPIEGDTKEFIVKYKKIADEVAKEIIQQVSKMRNLEEIQKLQIDSCTYLVVRAKLTKEQEESYGATHIILVATADKLNRYISYVNLMVTFLSMLVCAFLFWINVSLRRAHEKDQYKLKEYFQNASHELKTPIMNMESYAEGIALGVVEDKKEAAGIIVEECERMKQLVSEILLLSKVESGQCKLEKSKVDMRELVYFCIGNIETAARDRQLELQVALAELPEILVDEEWMERAVGNVMDNAVRYANSRIDICAKLQKKYIVIEIKNDGEEIEEADLERIFKRFYIGKGGQHGLGLAIAKQVMVLHGGTIEARNENGVVFVLKVPIKKRRK